MANGVYRVAAAGYLPWFARNAFATTNDNFVRSVEKIAVGTSGYVSESVPCRLYYGLFESLSSTIAYYVQIFDSAVAPTNGAIPIWQQRLFPTSIGVAQPPLDLAIINGIPCYSGLSVALSTTPGSLTLAAADDLITRCLIVAKRR